MLMLMPSSIRACSSTEFCRSGAPSGCMCGYPIEGELRPMPGRPLRLGERGGTAPGTVAKSSRPRRALDSDRGGVDGPGTAGAEAWRA